MGQGELHEQCPVIRGDAAGGFGLMEQRAAANGSGLASLATGSEAMPQAFSAVLAVGAGHGRLSPIAAASIPVMRVPCSINFTAA